MGGERVRGEVMGGKVANCVCLTAGLQDEQLHVGGQEGHTHIHYRSLDKRFGWRIWCLETGEKGCGQE